ncbi:MAG: hypothetical protein RIC04_14240 [Parvibaculum sp.]|uniref:hypothetical protein n=1 Tax=Parvibaculum sp. TaxID=2024848 RepID=UPI0032F03A5B
MRPLPLTIVLALALSAGGCASVLDGTEQTIRINATPHTTVCEATRNGVFLGSTSAHTSMLHLTKSRHDVLLTCAAPGHETASAILSSSATANGVMSVFVFDLGITDYVTGALNRYPAAATVSLKPLPLDGQAMGDCVLSGGQVTMQNSDCRRLGGTPLG